MELHVATGTDPESILAAALAARRPRDALRDRRSQSLEEVFIEKVGHIEIEEERHLAGGPCIRGGRRGAGVNPSLVRS